MTEPIAARSRSVAEIRTTGAAWVTETELARLCDLAERTSTPILCPRVVFDCGHVAYIWPDEYGDGSAWCQACGAFQCYDRCEECASFDCDHRETK